MTDKIKMLALSVTGQCNLACVYCYAFEHNKNMMSVDTALKAVDLAAQSQERFVLQFTGGEPLLNFPCVKAVIAYVKANKINCAMQLQTNGTVLTHEIAEYLYTNGCGIGISLDGRPAINDKMRKLSDGKGATNEILKGFAVLQEMGLGCGVTCVVSEDNVDSLSGIVDMAVYLGNVKRLGFDLLRGQGRGTKVLPASAQKVSKAIQETYEKAALFRQQIGFELQFSQLERVKVLQQNAMECFGHCYAMNGQAAFVDAQGNIYACSSFVGDKEFYLGNVESGIVQEKRQKIAEKIKASMQFCFSCEEFPLCGGGCYARWYGSNTDGAYATECALKKASIQWFKEHNH